MLRYSTTFSLFTPLSLKRIPQYPKEKSKGLGFIVKIFSNISATIIEILLIQAACCYIELTVCQTPDYMPIVVRYYPHDPVR